MLNVLHQVEIGDVQKRNSLQLVERIRRLKARVLRRRHEPRRSRRMATTAWRLRRSSSGRGS